MIWLRGTIRATTTTTTCFAAASVVFALGRELLHQIRRVDDVALPGEGYGLSLVPGGGPFE